MKKMIFTLVLAIVSSMWMTNEASNWCMPAAQTSTEQPIRIGGTFQTDIFPCVDETEPCPPCLTIVLASGGHYYLVSDDPQVLATLDTVTIGSFAIIEGIHYLEGHYDFIHVTHIFFPETDITQLTGEWKVYKETVSTPTGDAGTRWFSTHDVNNTNYIIENNSIYKVVLDQASGYAHYSDIVPYSIERKEDGTWLLTAEGLFSSANPVEEGVPTPLIIYQLTENEIEWVFAANGGDEGPNYYYQYLRRYNNTQNDKLPSLCDEWNVLEISNVTCGYCEEYRTYNFHLTTDTVIGGLLYSQLIKDGAYKGALREGNNRDIYCVPAGCSQEYLLYAFNAQVGDSLKNIWVGGYSSWIPDVRSVIVSEIKQTTPRTIELEVHYYEAPDAYEESIRNLTWIEGIGMPSGPMGAECSVFNGCADSKAKLLLCAYKNGEQVYVSDWGEQYGCEYNYNPYETPTDTIPLFSYTGDDPGSSTVDPVDPNQVVATLNGNQLTIHENSGEEINYTLRHNTSAQTPALRMSPKADSFREEVTIAITESGEYTLQLTNPSWGYTIYGQFNYSPQGIDQIPVPAEENRGEREGNARKILLNGQILIIRGGKTFTLSGQITDGQPTVNRQSKPR